MDYLASFASDSLKQKQAADMEQKQAQDSAQSTAKAADAKTADSAVDSKLADSKQAAAASVDTKVAGGETKQEEEPVEHYDVYELMSELVTYHGQPNELVDIHSEDDPGFYDPARLCKELNLLLENHTTLVEEMRAATNWNAWPETNLYEAEDGKDWKVVPFLHTFPATDVANSEWVQANCKQCPKTVELLRKIPGIRTALYSRMSPGTKLTPHTGWAALSNHVIRCHIPLVAEENTSGVWVLGKVQFHKLKPKPQILVFDDAKIHLGFNLDKSRYRCVLIVDVIRPDWMPAGQAKGGMTEHLTAYIDRFREEVNRVKDPSENAPVKW